MLKIEVTHMKLLIFNPYSLNRAILYCLNFQSFSYYTKVYKKAFTIIKITI